MKKIKCNSIFLKPDNIDQVKWFFRMKRCSFLLRVLNVAYDKENDGYVVKIKGLLAGYVIKKNNKEFLGSDLQTCVYRIPKRRE